jgi:histidyl-tRNA synthetase
VDAFIVSVGDEAELASFTLAEQLKDANSQWTVLRHCGGGSFKSQMKKSDKSGARFTLIIGEDEYAKGICQVKDMNTGEQTECSLASVASYLSQQV